MSELTFEEYQKKATTTAVYPGQGEFLGVMYTAIGLADEAGEVLGKVKKAIRDDNCEVTPERREAILDEVGDVLWYAAQIANELDAHLIDIADRNLVKLFDRKERGVLKGSGDNR